MPNPKMERINALVLQRKNPAIFMGGSGDYRPESIFGSEGISFENKHVGKATSSIIVRNLQSFRYVSSILTTIKHSIWRTLGDVRSKSSS